ncbi:MAG: putative transposase, partial [Mycobacteriales bacterium]
RLGPGGHQTHILTSRTDLSAAEVAHRMFSRWRAENYFRYGRAHFALDALDSYGASPADLDRSVPGPAKRKALGAVRRARAALSTATAARDGGLAALVHASAESGEPAALTDAHHGAEQSVTDAAAALAVAEQAHKAIPARIPLRDRDPDMMVLDTETKLVTHAVRMSAYNAESALARLLRPHYARGDDEARALLREAFTIPGDVYIDEDRRVLHCRLNPLSAPRRTRALAALCDELTETKTTYPGTNLVIHYSVKPHPVIA